MNTKIIDAYIANDEAIKKLELEQKQMREFLLEMNLAEMHGTTRMLKVGTSERKTVDWKMLAAEQKIPKEVVESFTKTSTVTTLRIV
jgi:hypothetical protein